MRPSVGNRCTVLLGFAPERLCSRLTTLLASSADMRGLTAVGETRLPKRRNCTNSSPERRGLSEMSVACSFSAWSIRRETSRCSGRLVFSLDSATQMLVASLAASAASEERTVLSTEEISSRAANPSSGCLPRARMMGSAIRSPRPSERKLIRAPNVANTTTGVVPSICMTAASISSARRITAGSLMHG